MLRPGALGDTLLAVPALRALRRAYASVTLGAHAGAARLLAQVGEVDVGLAFDDPSLSWVFTGTQVPHEPVVAWMGGATAPGLRHALVVAPSRPQDGEHCARYLLSTLTPLGIDRSCDDRALRVPPVRSDEVLVHPGSGSPGKNWPAARFASVIRTLAAPVRLIVGEADDQVAGEVEACVGKPLARLERQPLKTLAARLAGCRAYVGNDSGISHLAGLCGARTVALFGPTNPDLWRPIGPDVHVLPFETDPADVAAYLT